MADEECPPDCPLCKVTVQMDEHFDSCVKCIAGEVCDTMDALRAEEKKALLEIFPDWDEHHK